MQCYIIFIQKRRWWFILRGQFSLEEEIVRCTSDHDIVLILIDVCLQVADKVAKTEKFSWLSHSKVLAVDIIFWSTNISWINWDQSSDVQIFSFEEEHPMIWLKQQRTEEHPMIWLKQQRTEEHPMIWLKQQRTEEHPMIWLKQQRTEEHPMIWLKQQPKNSQLFEFLWKTSPRWQGNPIEGFSAGEVLSLTYACECQMRRGKTESQG